jgi:hypothetical protein
MGLVDLRFLADYMHHTWNLLLCRSLDNIYTQSMKHVILSQVKHRVDLPISISIPAYKNRWPRLAVGV